MSGKICGSCANWRCDDPLHLKGHCILDRRERPHGAMCDTCIKFESAFANYLHSKLKGEEDDT